MEVADQRDLFPGLGIAVRLAYVGGGSPKHVLSMSRERGLSVRQIIEFNRMWPIT